MSVSSLSSLLTFWSLLATEVELNSDRQMPRAQSIKRRAIMEVGLRALISAQILGAVFADTYEINKAFGLSDSDSLNYFGFH